MGDKWIIILYYYDGERVYIMIVHTAENSFVCVVLKITVAAAAGVGIRVVVALTNNKAAPYSNILIVRPIRGRVYNLENCVDQINAVGGGLKDGRL